MACAKLDQCMLGVTCEQLSGFIDCETEQGVCIGECVLAVDCAEILDLPQSPCVAACQGGQGGAGGGGSCVDCASANCDVASCFGDPACMAFLSCAQGCAQGDDACLLACADSNPGPGTTTFVDCTCASCADSCPCPGTGAGGAGGNGAGGGMMGTGGGMMGAGGANPTGAGGAMTTGPGGGN
jgi:hypothetical protein